MNLRITNLLIWFLIILTSIPILKLSADSALESGWQNPPVESRLRAYWWWLNGNVTKKAITRDLEEMRLKGFGGALICDAGGAEQDGNAPVKQGVPFFSNEWREIYKHTLKEANRLGLEIGLNIQSGWNLGGPMVAPDDAAKKLVWSEIVITGGSEFNAKLPAPARRDNYYRDLYVLAYPVKKQNISVKEIKSSSNQKDHQPIYLIDNNTNTFWVSGGEKPDEGPSPSKPEFLEIVFNNLLPVKQIEICNRPGYGARSIIISNSADGVHFTNCGSFSINKNPFKIDFEKALLSKVVKIAITSASDPKFPDNPRNVQISEINIYDETGKNLVRSNNKKPIMNWQQKAMIRTLHFSAPDTTPLLIDYPSEPGEEDAALSDVIDLTSNFDSRQEMLKWKAPEGEWQILRFGYTIGDNARVSTCSDNWKGYAIDVLDSGAFNRYWKAVVEPLIIDAGDLAGKTLKYLHTDSWEIEAINWTPTFREEFKKRRGYDLIHYLPVIAGKIIQNREVSNRFLHDFRRTLGDLAIDNHYRLFKEYAHKYGILIHPESGGPHSVPIDAQQCLGYNDIPMSEFWAWSWRHRIGDSNRFFCKQPASAAHTYGRRFVAAEGFTTIGPHWQETIWDNLKPSFDRALCEGMNLLMWHAFVCSPQEFGLPGIQYFAGTHFNPNSTWWNWSEGFLSYIDRCQFMLQQGLFIADVCYYYGDHVPNFAQLKASDPAKILPGYDYDVITADALIERLSVRDGKLFLPDGMNYSVLVLPDRTAISLNVLKKVRELVHNGAVVIGRKPKSATGLSDYPRSDEEVKKIADELWDNNNTAKFIKGKVVQNYNTREVLFSLGIEQDFDLVEKQYLPDFDYIHRRAGDTEIYFVVNKTNQWREVNCSFRVKDRAPELWNPVSGERRFAGAYKADKNRIAVPLQFPPYGAWFVIFREPTQKHIPDSEKNSYEFKTVAELTPPFTVFFNTNMNAPQSVVFDKLISWTVREEDGIKYYSGAATYLKEFVLNNLSNNEHYYIDLGDLRELAEVRLNGKSVGIVWAPPFRLNLSGHLKAGSNRLEIIVINFWPNRIIGDLNLPEEKRITKTNIRKFTKDSKLMDSGLFGPVKIVSRIK
ncbi:MAG: glycosyl hydrolase [Verrucomicrobiia bacterium]